MASIYADLINLKITNLEIAKQFILEELDAARSGSEEAIIFVKNSGFKEEEYIGAMQNSFEEVDGANGPQQLLLHLVMTLAPDMKLVTTFRIKIVSNIMRIWSLGQYNNKFPNMCAKTNEEELRLISLIHKNENSEYGDFLNLYRDLDRFFGHIHIDSKLNVSFERNQECSDLIKMAYGYTLRSVMAGLYVQGLLTRDTYNQARVLFNALQQTTDQNKDFQIEASKQADELIYSYNEELDGIITAVLVANMENNYDNNLKANEVYAFDQVVLLLNKMVTTQSIRKPL